MRAECEHLKGRKRDLCCGYGLDGRANPTQDASDAQRISMGLDPVTVTEPPVQQLATKRQSKCPQVSQIGTRLANIFRDTWGAIPCGECKQAIAEMNCMTADDIQRHRDMLVKSIATRAMKSTPKYWQKITVFADQQLHLGGTEYVIGLCLDRACRQESGDA